MLILKLQIAFFQMCEFIFLYTTLFERVFIKTKTINYVMVLKARCFFCFKKFQQHSCLLIKPIILRINTWIFYLTVHQHPT